MYVITHHHDYDEVLLGPIEWNPKFIASVLRSDLDLPYTPAVLASDAQKVPYEILPNVWVRRVITINEEHNPKIQTLMGPYWSYNENQEAFATYKAQYKPLEIVKAELKQEVAAERYKKEVAGIKVNIQGQDVTIDTNRGDRDIFVQKYLLMNDGETAQWKFPEGWMTITKAELASIVSAGANHVQSVFNWESTKAAEIDAKTTHDELVSFTIIEPPQQDN